MPGHRNTGHGTYEAIDTPPALRPVSDSFRKAKASALGWLGGVLGLLVVATISWIAANMWDVQTRMVRMETKVEAMEKALDRIESNTAQHDVRVANGTK